jgi:UDPglucose 6-dehydrogenase
VHYKNNLQGKHFALLDLAFKLNTEDILEAPVLSIIDALIKAGATVTAYDPEAMSNMKDQIGDKINYTENQYQSLEGATELLIAIEWSEFRILDFELIDQHLKQNKIVFDGRNVFDVAKMKRLGYHFESIGRAIV